MSKAEETNLLSQLGANPWLKVLQVLVLALCTAAITVVSRAEVNINGKINENKVTIKSLEDEVDVLSDEIKSVEKTQAEISATLKFIKEATEEIKDDIKELSKKR